TGDDALRAVVAGTITIWELGTFPFAFSLFFSASSFRLCFSPSVAEGTKSGTDELEGAWTFVTSPFLLVFPSPFLAGAIHFESGLRLLPFFYPPFILS
ncbi:hypothetical protein B0H14DRAFT_2712120, partial [Mycena olivaceomarginata]